MIRVTREHLGNILPQHGEEDLAERVLTITDAELGASGESARITPGPKKRSSWGSAWEERGRSGL
jgi:hypothetical protein